MPTSAPIKLPVLFQDDQLIAINKPAGLLVHRTAIDRHEHNNVVKMLSRQTGLYLYPVHRLDKATSGVLIFALSKPTAQLISKQMASDGSRKSYLGVVRGHTIGSAIIDHPIRDRDNKHREKQLARTEYVTLKQIELPFATERYPTSRYSLLSIRPVTGRRHQIRLHMKHISHPIVGDSSYGKSEHNRFFRRYFNCRRLLLHASALCLTHPSTGRQITFEAAVTDSAFVRVLTHPDWSEPTPG